MRVRRCYVMNAMAHACIALAGVMAILLSFLFSAATALGAVNPTLSSSLSLAASDGQCHVVAGAVIPALAYRCRR